jgi:hypothetical protein
MGTYKAENTHYFDCVTGFRFGVREYPTGGHCNAAI